MRMVLAWTLKSRIFNIVTPKNLIMLKENDNLYRAEIRYSSGEFYVDVDTLTIKKVTTQLLKCSSNNKLTNSFDLISISKNTFQAKGSKKQYYISKDVAVMTEKRRISKQLDDATSEAK